MEINWIIRGRFAAELMLIQKLCVYAVLFSSMRRIAAKFDLRVFLLK
jgi:hypothetical protein